MARAAAKPIEEKPEEVVSTEQVPVAEATGTAVVVSIRDRLAEMLLEDEGAGQENVRVEDMAIPRVYILQSNSPQVKKSDGKYIDGAEEGDFYNNVTGQVIKQKPGMVVVPVMYRREVSEWKPRGGDGGGLVKTYGDDEAIFAKTSKNEKKKDVLPNGNEVVLTHEFYSFIVDTLSGFYFRAVIGFASTQTKKARRWNTVINGRQVEKPGGGTFNPAMFYTAFRMTTVPEQNPSGSWMGWKIDIEADTLDIKNGETIYLAARAFRKSVLEGAVKVAEDGVRDNGGAEAGQRSDNGGGYPDGYGGGNEPPIEDDEIPF